VWTFLPNGRSCRAALETSSMAYQERRRLVEEAGDLAQLVESVCRAPRRPGPCRAPTNSVLTAQCDRPTSLPVCG